MTSINGIDPIIVNNIKVQTQKQVILETQKTKISDDKKDKDKNQQHAEHPPEYPLQSLIDAVDKLNKLLVKNKIPLFFQIIKKSADIKVQLINSDNQDLIAELSPEKVLRMVAEFNTKGLTIDELI